MRADTFNRDKLFKEIFILLADKTNKPGSKLAEGGIALHVMQGDKGNSLPDMPLQVGNIHGGRKNLIADITNGDNRRRFAYRINTPLNPGNHCVCNLFEFPAKPTPRANEDSILGAMGIGKSSQVYIAIN